MERFEEPKISVSEKEYTMFAELIYKSSGIYLGGNKQELLKTRFQKIMRRLKCKSFRDYYNKVVNDKSCELFSEMLDAISTNHTYFFREKEHFNYLKRNALPALIQKKTINRDRRIRFWCAASSSGEEPYTTMITVVETINLANWDFKMLATDISTKVLKKAIEGRYSRDKLKEMSPLLVEKYFTCEDIDKTKMYVVKDDLRKYISYRHFNLMTPQFPFKGKFDIIFCRNVMIYFDLATQQKLVEKLHHYLEPEGFFFIGHSENISGPARMKFKPIAPSVFQKI
jgi:chemotaxis protein methyltransferase CheR